MTEADTTPADTTSTESHRVRSLFKFLVITGIIVAIAKVVADRSKEFAGLTETEAREKFESSLGRRIGEEKAAEVADQVIPRLKEKGMIKPDPVEQAMEDAKDVASDAADEVKDATSDAGDAVKDVTEKAGDSVKDAVDQVGKKLD